MDHASRIYIAGHTGLIGSAFIRNLHAQGYKNVISAPHFELELTDFDAVMDFFEKNKPEYVVLAAGRVGGIVENNTYPADFMNANLAIQLNVLRAARQHDVRKLILFASSCMYPRECPQPMAETALFTGVPEPTSMAYAVSKMAGMQMCIAYNKQDGDNRFIPVIPNSVYGPNDNFNPNSGHVLSALIRRFHEAKQENAQKVTLWGTGTPRREFLHSDDLARACLHLLADNASLPDLPINIGTGSDVSIHELADLVRGVVGYDGGIDLDPSKPDGAPRKLLDSARMLGTGWAPQITLDEGLQKTYEWFLHKIDGAKKAS